VGLSAWSARYAAAAPRPFAVPVPGGTRARLIVDGEVRRRGWFPADAPTSADLLIVCGDAGVELAEAIDVVWADVPGPRARVTVASGTSEAQVREALDGAVAALADRPRQRAEAMSRAEAGPWQPGEAAMADHAMHGDHMMGAPGGVAMAERAPDRDGLKLDVLHVPLGPVLRDWPGGLRVTLTLQGDVVQAAELHTFDGAGAERFWDEPWLAAVATRGAAERRRVAAHLDSLARFLGVAGWRDQADRACVLRDAVLAGRPADELKPRFERFARRVGRSRVLRWMTRGLGVIDQSAVVQYGLAGPAARRPGDVATRVAGWLAETRVALAAMEDPAPLADDEGPRGPVGSDSGLLTVLPPLLDGAELASARLIVASLDPVAEPADG
jgi:hypothetical protein